MSDTPHLIVGLGNPGPSYALTRHNIGALVVEELAGRHGARLGRHKAGAGDVAELRPMPGGPKLVLMRPRCFMNESGGPVKAVAAFFGVDPAHLIVVHDELDLDPGTVRHRAGGGDHGHRGLRSVSRALGGRDYGKLAVGIGRPPGRMAPADFVLGRFTRRERESLPITCADAADEVERLIGLR